MAESGAPPPSPSPLPASALRWRCDPRALGFGSTKDIEPIEGIVGQQTAVEALRFGLEIDAPGQNVYVRGLRGTGRLTLVRRLLEEIRPAARPSPDYCYVHDFEAPDRPKLLTLERGRGEAFRDRIRELCDFIARDLASALDTDLVKRRRAELERVAFARVAAITDPLEADLAKSGLALAMVRTDTITHPVVLPIVDGEPASPEQLAALQAEGKIGDEDLQRWSTEIDAVMPRVDETFKKVAKLQRELRREARELVRGHARAVLESAVADIRTDFPSLRVNAFVDAILHDVITNRLGSLDDTESFMKQYEVNLLVCHRRDDPSPVIVENAPSVRTLLGTIDATFGPEGRAQADHMAIHAGSLLRADGGVLIVEALEILSQPGAWAALVRTLRSGRVELVPPDLPIPWVAPSLEPEPIEINVKVVLIGEAGLYRLLDEQDADFSTLFKVLADFDTTIPRSSEGIGLYAGVLARIVREERLRPFDASGVAALVEHGARVAAARGKLTARFGRLADIAREASYLANKADSASVLEEHVVEAVRRTKRRADGPARHFRELVTSGTIRIATEGAVVGQINGLAVINAGPLTYGFPTRITATIGPGTRGAINIERESHLSGAIHTKSFYILGGLLRHLLPTEHALTFEASIAFEQSYGGIDGDSASAAEVVCLLSALTRLPVDQGLAMTGAIDQLGNVLPVGAVDEKVEGFYDTCHERGLTGRQGVVVPAANVGDLMLRRDLALACERGEFHVYAVDSIGEAITLFLGRAAGSKDATGPYAEGTVLAQAMQSARDLWHRASARPAEGPSRT
jgi:predicted ATP-dependent protease